MLIFYEVSGKLRQVYSINFYLSKLWNFVARSESHLSTLGVSNKYAQ